MAVNMSLDILALVKAANPEGEDTLKLAEVLLQKGWTFKHGIVSLMGSHPPTGVSITKNMPVLVGQILANKDVGEKSLHLFRTQLQAFLSECAFAHPGAVGGPYVAGDYPPDPTTNTDAEALKKALVIKEIALGKSVPAATQEIKAALQEKAVTSTTYVEVQGGAKVRPLSEATEIGQLVLGTSPGSVYRVFAYHPHLKMAYRALPGSLSIRAEGSALWLASPTVASALQALGFTTTQNSHMSMHCATSPHLPARRILGAVAMNAGIDFTQVTKPSELGN